MIHILDEVFQKKVRNGTLALDRAAVITLAISVRDDLVATPMIRCDVAFGTEEAGEFEPWDYNNSITTVPIFWEGKEAFGRLLAALRPKGPGTTGPDLAAKWILAVESSIVQEGKLGENAEIVQIKPKVIRRVEGG